MAIYKGFYEALLAGDLAGSPDIRLALAMSGFSYDADDINLADGTLDEYDGSNYARYDATGVTVAYVDAADEVRIDMDDGDFGTAPVGPATDDIAALVVYLHVDGTAANDIILGSSTAPAGLNGADGELLMVVPDEGLMFVRTAA